MILSDISIRRPVFTAMVTIGLMTLGILGSTKLGVDLFPDISFPIVVVTTVYPGAGPEEIEQQVTKNIEESVAAINGVETVRSFSRDSVSTVIVQFKLEADIKAAGTDVREKLAAIRPRLPQDIRDPVIMRMDPSAIPIVSYVVSSNRHPSETRRLAEDVIKPKLEAIDGVASVIVTGGLEREVKIFVDRAKLEGLGLGLAQVGQQLQMEGFDLPAGRVTTGGTELTVKTEGRFRTLDEMRSVVVASLANGSQVRLGEVAEIVDGYKDVRTFNRLDGKESVTLEIQKQGGSNTVAIADNVYAAVTKVQADLPPDVKLLKATDSSTFIRRNIRDVSHDIVFGGLMAILVIFIFMLDWRSTLISSLSLPTSVVTTFFAMWMLGFSFNMMSLLALSLSIGLLIDDAVVVRENIFRHMEMGKDPITAAREGTAEIGLAVMATTFTIVAVFVPVGFMGGLVGRMFKQFGLTVAAAVLVSLFVSFTLDPMMSARVMKPVGKNHKQEMENHPVFGRVTRAYERLDELYREVLRWTLGHKKTVIFGAIGLFVGTLYLTNFMGKEFVGQADRGEFQVTLEVPAGTSIGEMSRIAGDAEAAIKGSSPHVLSLFTTVGVGEESNKARVRVYTTKVETRRPITQGDIQNSVRGALRKIPNLTFAVTELGIIEGPVEMPVTFSVRGDDYVVLEEFARRALQVVKDTRGTADADMSFRAGKPETSIRVDRAKAADLGVSVGAVAQTLRLGVEGDVVAKFRDRDRDIDVRLQLAPEERGEVARLGELGVPAMGRRMGAVPSMAGPRLVRVDDVAQVVSGTGPATIEREARQRQIIITSNLNGRSLGEVTADIEAGLQKLDRPPGITFTFGGQAERMKETFSNMLIAMLVAILFIYFVLASQFESFIHPFTIMVALPLAIVGAFLLMFLSNMAIGMASMIGIILLMGLVTKNSILLVDYTNELRARGRNLTEALLEAGPTRLRPILMTSAAMVLGMLPGALARGEGSEFKAPMATAVIGGVIASTMLTLIVVPVVYTWFDRFTSRGHKEEAKAHQPHPTPGPDAVPAHVRTLVPEKP